MMKTHALQSFQEYLWMQGLSPHTVKAFLADIRQYEAYAGTDEPERAIEWLSTLKQKGLTNKTIARKRTSLMAYYKFKNIPVEIPSIKIEKKLPEALTETEAKALLEQATHSRFPERDRLIVELMLRCGVRSSELLSLTAGSVREEDGMMYLFISQGKGRKDRRIPIPHKALQGKLRRYVRRRDPEERLFQLNSRNLRRAIHNLGVAAGLKRRVYPHLLRHTSATMYLRKGANIESVRRVLGHESLATTQKYLALTDEDIAQDIARANW